MSPDTELPELRSIRAPRHPGVSAGSCEAFSEAAEVCFARHHEPPRTLLHVACAGKESTRFLKWSQPDETAKRSCGNRNDATRDGAYIVSLAVVERELGMVALSRADTRTGADYYIGKPGLPDLEGAFRLEVSGVDEGGLADVRKRLKSKEDQAARGDCPLPAYASVVGFRQAAVLVSQVEVSSHE